MIDNPVVIGRAVRLTVGLLMVAAVLAGCANQGDTSAPGSVPLTVVADGGIPALAAPSVLASTSLDDLRAVYAGITSATDLKCETCWTGVKNSPGKLYVAAWINVPCSATDSVAAFVKDTTLNIAVRAHEVCLAGQAAAVAPQFSLVSIPLARLPAQVITIQLDHRGNVTAAPGRALAATAVVDLEQPGAAVPAPEQRSDEVRFAIGQAKRRAAVALQEQPSAFRLVEFGMQRWPDTGLGCPPAGFHGLPVPTQAYTLVLSDGQTTVEYHASTASFFDCPRTAS